MKFGKRYIRFVVAILIAILLLSVNPIYGDDILPADEYEVDLSFETVSPVGSKDIILNAKYAVAIEAGTKRVLYEKNAYDKSAMASTTKIMTAIVAIDYGKLDDVVTVSNKAAYTSGSVIKLKAGEKIKLLDLIYGLMLESGNDAAVAIAEHIAGSEEEYLKLMNQKALEFGAFNTSFTTVHGLDDPNHYTTAYDLASIAAECLKNDMFKKVVSTAETYISNRHLRNTNDLLFTYEGAIGVKTGFTNNAGRCLVAAAKRDGMEIITVVLGCADKKSRFSDSRKLLDNSFERYSLKTVLEEGKLITTISVVKGKNTHVKLLCTDTVILPMSEDEKSAYEIVISAENEIKAPFKEGEIVGKLYITFKGETFAVSEVKLAQSVDSKGFSDFFQDIFRTWREIMK